ncbi:MAG: thymidine kinase [Amylibacter sp.]|nr:thymidine kinase [Amylibacter sp.]
MSKVVILFLIFIMMLGIFGRLRLPKVKNPFKSKTVKAAKKCERCGRYNTAGETCSCGDDV